MSEPATDPAPPAADQAVTVRRPRLSERTLWVLFGIAAALLVAGIVFAVWVNATPTLHPVPVTSRASA